MSLQPCIATLDNNKLQFHKYMKDVQAEFSLRGRVTGLITQRESRLPQLIRGATEVYSACSGIVAERAQELEARRQELVAYAMKKINDLERYAAEALPGNEKVSTENGRFEACNIAITTKKNALEAKLSLFDAAYNSALHKDRVHDTESKLADTEYLVEVVTSLAHVFKYVGDRMSREEEHLRAIAESVCTMIELKPFGKAVTTLGERVKQTVRAGYVALDDSILQIKSAVNAVEMPRLLAKGRTF